MEQREREGGERVTYGGVDGGGRRSNDLVGKHPLLQLAPGSAGACSVAAARKFWSPTAIVGLVELAANDRG